MPKKLSQKEFIKRANKAHNNRYDYSLIEYKNSYTKIKIICPIHGEFMQCPDTHARKGAGCPSCGGSVKLTQEKFIKRAKAKFPQYDYSKVEYINGQTKIKIICSEHGEWEQIPANFLRYKGCPKCANGEMSLKQFVKKASKVHKWKI
jgi:ssDNA-binding Zn-finger/Zn-ribbon topoisomerase 1